MEKFGFMRSEFASGLISVGQSSTGEGSVAASPVQAVKQLDKDFGKIICYAVY
jgi:hypothetical protein